MKSSPAYRKLHLLLLMFFVVINQGYSQDDSNVIKSWLEYTDAPNSLYKHLTGQAYDYLDLRAETVASIETLAGWKERQAYIKTTLNELVGTFPEKTPLNAKIVRTLTKDDFRIEHVIFESQPGFFVTSSLFIPSSLKKRTRAPAIIYCSGHSAEGYRSEVYLHVIQNLVRKGFIVFAFDPVGQGERLEYFNPETGISMLGGPTKEHSYPGAQAFITGSSQAMFMIWDGIRAVDYLLSRKEVDPSRIGITGRSGGGTQSAYIAAFDDRIKAVAPENYITNFRRLLQSIGPQDAEQNMVSFIERGLDHPDLLIVRAPKPAMMITTTNDFFSIQGARETEKEVSEIYRSYGMERNFSRVEDNAGHESTRKNRESMYSFFQKHLDNPGNPDDEETITLTEEEMKVSVTGQVSTSSGGETVHSINLIYAEKLEGELVRKRNNPGISLPEMTVAAKKLSGFREPAVLELPVMTGSLPRGNHVAEKYFVKGEGDYQIPYLHYKPEKSSGKTVIYLNQDGKSSAFSDNNVDLFLANGISVITPDLVGTGETGPGAIHGDADFEGSSHNLWYASLLIGRSITGIRASDVVRLARLIKEAGQADEIIGFAVGDMAAVMLHAACFSQDISSMMLVNPLLSYRQIVMNRLYDPRLVQCAVAGALEEYDLPDLAAAFAPRRLFIAGTSESSDERTTATVNEADLAIVREAYSRLKANENLRINLVTSGKGLQDLLIEWLY
ncbi:MAG: acetylxylan esterase [Bacteroidales bacterium]|jgi:cephalosporin-C deacetylase-like acetyl esterase|nr:acetylxylan esterase [Bacteroidales bacterium]